jgi:hypothetical protein
MIWLHSSTQHSNIGGQVYADFTSYMSAGYGTPYWPMKSFNGANNWQLGWYSDRTISVNPSSGGQLVTLATFVDYNKSNTQNPVLIQVGTDTYLQYNRAKGFNYQTEQHVDQVTVVQQLNNGTNIFGAVDPISNLTLTITNFGGSGQNVVIAACKNGTGDANNPDWMSISIGYDESYCSTFITATAAPTSKTSKPTSRPTSPPSVRPTLAPTVKPTTVSSSAACYDTLNTFPVTGYGNQGCIWLAARPTQIKALCPRSDVSSACPRTCKVCTSTCKDSSKAKFKDSSGISRSCSWLAIRPTTWSTYCANPTTSKLCPVTCHSC